MQNLPLRFSLIVHAIVRGCRAEPSVISGKPTHAESRFHLSTHDLLGKRVEARLGVQRGLVWRFG